MRTILGLPLLLSVALLAAPALAQDEPDGELLAPDQLDNLLAPIALYPDPLLAQVLVAATFPDQVDEAARFVRGDGDPDDVDGQPWDVSVKAVAHYPEVLEMMADKLDWTTTLGQAYVNQSADVMASVQRLRAQAEQAGNLVSSPEMEVVNSGDGIEIWPAQPQYIYVPTYDPGLVFFARAPLFFATRFVIGAWLNLDFDWHQRHMFYHGWDRGRGWMERSRPYVHVTNVYVNNSYRDIRVNRNVVRRPVDYRELDRYDQVHRRTNFDNVHSRSVKVPPPPPVQPQFNNKIIVRNVNVNDPRLNEFRGHPPKPPNVVKVPDVPAFTPVHSGFDTHQVSTRGQVSRAKVSPPPPPPPPHPQVKRDERRHP